MESIELKKNLESVLANAGTALYRMLIDGNTLDNRKDAMQAYLEIRDFMPLLRGVDLVTSEMVEIAGVRLSKQLKGEVLGILRGGQGSAIPAIKLLRTRIEGLSLKDAKHVIDKLREGLKYPVGAE